MQGSSAKCLTRVTPPPRVTTIPAARGELGLTRSQMISLERELETTQRQLRSSESRAEQAAYEYKASRMGGRARDDDTFNMWD